MENINIRLEKEKDYKIVENVTREAFWNQHKPGCDEHYFVHEMRNHKDFIPELAFVLEKEGEIIGNVMYAKGLLVADDGEVKDIITMGPISVLPQYQRQGLSRILLEYSFEKAKEMGYTVVVNFGHPCNYISRGYVSCKHKNVSIDENMYPSALLVKELVLGILDGKNWRYVPSDIENCCEDIEAVETFDKDFPTKEKAWRPSQEEFYIYSHSNIVR